MNPFGIALKDAREKAGKKLREVKEAVDLSIGYLSDMEQGRKPPPDDKTIMKLETFLKVTGSRLLKAAREARTLRPTEVSQKIRKTPQLSELYFRVKDMSEEELQKVIDGIPKK